MNKFASGPGWLELIDGPGKGQKFFVQRAPVFVRAVQSVDGTWDVLNELDDEPLSQEEVFVYKQEKWVHVRATNPRQSGVYYTYVYIPIDVDLKLTLRFTKQWQEWASNQPT